MVRKSILDKFSGQSSFKGEKCFGVFIAYLVFNLAIF